MKIFGIEFIYVASLPWLGGLGQLGLQCAKLLRNKYGESSVILSDIIKPSREISESGPYIFADILDFKVKFQELPILRI